MCLFCVVEPATGVDPVYRRRVREGTGNHHAGCDGGQQFKALGERTGS